MHRFVGGWALLSLLLLVTLVTTTQLDDSLAVDHHLPQGTKLSGAVVDVVIPRPEQLQLDDDAAAAASVLPTNWDNNMPMVIATPTGMPLLQQQQQQHRRQLVSRAVVKPRVVSAITVAHSNDQVQRLLLEQPSKEEEFDHPLVIRDSPLQQPQQRHLAMMPFPSSLSLSVSFSASPLWKDMIRPALIQVMTLMIFQVVGIPLLSRLFAVAMDSGGVGVGIGAILKSVSPPWFKRALTSRWKPIWNALYHGGRPPIRMLRKAQKFIKAWYAPGKSRPRRLQQPQERQELTTMEQSHKFRQ